MFTFIYLKLFEVEEIGVTFELLDNTSRGNSLLSKPWGMINVVSFYIKGFSRNYPPHVVIFEDGFFLNRNWVNFFFKKLAPPWISRSNKLNFEILPRPSNEGTILIKSSQYPLIFLGEGEGYQTFFFTKYQPW